MKKLEHSVIYSDPQFYSAFPSVVSRADGELLVAFRRAPDRRTYMAPHVCHCDPNSYLVLVRSRDLGRTWSSSPELVYAHPLGGSQDPCMVQLATGEIVLTSYAWMILPPEAVPHAAQNRGYHVCNWPFTFLGGYVLRSDDGASTWQGPFLPPQLATQATFFPGISIPAMNRGAMVEARDANLYWAVACAPRQAPEQTTLELLVSEDKGVSWAHKSHIAGDRTVVFNETSLIETPGGDLVGFARTSHLDDHGVIVRSRDLGATWEPWQDAGLVGHPYHAIRLPGGATFVVYGYRHSPYGIRARVFDPECSQRLGPEIVVRDDGGSTDVGYPWACNTADGRVLVVYYFQSGGTRYIAGTFLQP